MAEWDEEGNFAAEINQKTRNENVENSCNDGCCHGDGR